MHKFITFCVLALNILSSQAIDLDCNDKTLDDCNYGDQVPFETAKLSSADKCQQFCSQIYDQCTFFIFDEKELVCQMFDYDMEDYEKNCKVFGHATSVGDLTECDAEKEPCYSFVDGYCRFEGELTDNYEEINAKEVCLSACQLSGNSNYFLHNSELRNCQCLQITNKICDLKRGPRTPELSTCGSSTSTAPTSTTATSTSTASTSTTATSTSTAENTENPFLEYSDFSL